MTTREQRSVFGEVAEDYDAVRAAYPPELVDAVLRSAGVPPRSIVEVGAGTGLATQSFAPLGTPITCIEPDPEMAAVLARKFAGHEHVNVVIGRFEDWMPPAGGVDLLYCAQAWHWVDPATRLQLGHDALAPGGVLALFGHAYIFADPAMREAVEDVYRRMAPSLLEDPSNPVRPSFAWDADEVEASGLWTEVATEEFEWTKVYPTEVYVQLANTFSAHRMLAPELLARVGDALRKAIDARGGVVEHAMRTFLVTARRGD